MIRIKEIRKQKGIKAKDIAASLGVAQNTMSQYESGKRQMDYSTLSKVAKFLGVSVGELLGEESTAESVEFVEKEKSPSSEDEELEKKVKMIRSMLAVMSEEDRKKVLQYANSLFQDMM